MKLTIISAVAAAALFAGCATRQANSQAVQDIAVELAPAPEAAEEPTAAPAAPKPAKPRPPGTVAFVVENAGLRDQVLRLFAEQAGVEVIWRGEDRPVTVSIVEPLPWQTALEIVARFTNTRVRFDGERKATLFDAAEPKKFSKAPKFPSLRGKKAPEGSGG